MAIHLVSVILYFNHVKHMTEDVLEHKGEFSYKT